MCVYRREDKCVHVCYRWDNDVCLLPAVLRGSDLIVTWLRYIYMTHLCFLVWTYWLWKWRERKGGKKVYVGWKTKLAVRIRGDMTVNGMMSDWKVLHNLLGNGKWRKRCRWIFCRRKKTNWGVRIGKVKSKLGVEWANEKVLHNLPGSGKWERKCR